MSYENEQEQIDLLDGADGMEAAAESSSTDDGYDMPEILLGEDAQQASAYPTPCSFTTGVAGSGKSFLLRQRIDEDPYYAVLSSSTGISAVNLNATTINSLLGFFDTASLKDAYLQGSAQRKLRKLAEEGFQNVVVDECSMISKDSLQLLVNVFDNVNSSRASGQALIGLGLCGDCCQLPPIPDRPIGAARAWRGQAEQIPWLFEAECWPRFAENTLKLTKIWRQDNPTFLAALNHARAGQGDAAVSALQAAGVQFESVVNMEFDGTTIVGTNEEANRLNQMALDRVEGRVISLPARRWGKLRSEWSDKLIPERTVLKENAYVTILANRKIGPVDFEYVNGDCGWVRGIQPSTDKRTPPMIAVELVRNGQTVLIGPLVRHVDYREKPDGVKVEHEVPASEDLGRFIPKPHYRKAERRYVLGQIEYYPLKLAYASTCHRAQGLTLDRVQVDMRSWQWQKPSMGYVAVSRCRTPQGLRLVGMKEKVAKAFVCDPKVRNWL